MALFLRRILWLVVCYEWALMGVGFRAQATCLPLTQEAKLVSTVANLLLLLLSTGTALGIACTAYQRLEVVDVICNPILMTRLWLSGLLFVWVGAAWWAQPTDPSLVCGYMNTWGILLIWTYGIFIWMQELVLIGRKMRNVPYSPVIGYLSQPGSPA